MIAPQRFSATSGDPFPPGTERIDYVSDTDGVADRAYFVPGVMRRSDCIVNLHGWGSPGEQLFTRPDIREHWLTFFLREGFSILAPHLRGDVFMNPAAVVDLHDLLRVVRRRHAVRRFLFFSGSMGASGALVYAALHPEDAQAVVALGAVTDLATFYRWCTHQTGSTVRAIGESIRVAYGGTPDEQPAIYERHSVVAHAAALSMPLFLAHGDADATIPFEQATLLANALRDKDNFTFHTIPGGNHDSPLFLPEAEAFLLQQAPSLAGGDSL